VCFLERSPSSLKIRAPELFRGSGAPASLEPLSPLALQHCCGNYFPGLFGIELLEKLFDLRMHLDVHKNSNSVPCGRGQ